MKPLTERGVFLLEILLCGAVSSALAALLTGFYPQKALLWLLLTSLGGLAGILLLCWRYLQRRDQVVQAAARQIAEYLLANRQGGLECNEDGALYQLFHEVNSLLAIANAHADNERRVKEFLRNIISDISHQLKTPLAALDIYNGIIQQEAADPETVRQFADLSEQELDRIELLVQNLLKMARLEAGAITLERKPERLAELLAQVRQQYLFRSLQEQKQIELLGDEQTTLLCDRVWLAEALGNLVKNALEHTQPGDKILIRWQQSPCLTQISVEDNGSGIHPEDLYHIFKRFYRSRFSQATQGIGLGLSLAKSIIEAHQGSVEVRSQLGQGTVFTVSLPK